MVCSTLNHGFHLRMEAVSRFPSQLQLITGTIILHRSYRQGFLESEKSHCIKQSYRYTKDHFSRNIKLTSAIIQWDCSGSSERAGQLVQPECKFWMELFKWKLVDSLSQASLEVTSKRGTQTMEIWLREVNKDLTQTITLPIMNWCMVSSFNCWTMTAQQEKGMGPGICFTTDWNVDRLS